MNKPKPIPIRHAVGIAAGLFVVMSMFTNELARLVAIALYMAAVIWWVRRDERRARRAERWRLAFDADCQHAALMNGDIEAGVFGEPAIPQEEVTP